MLRESLGLSKPADLCHDLDTLAGVWSREHVEGFTVVIRRFEEIEGLLTASTIDHLLP